MCVLDDTATPKINTYRHTLSLHDALTIFLYLHGGVRDDGELFRRREQHHGMDAAPRNRRGPGAPVRRANAEGPERNRGHRSGRSEEHTSELQSLMRISYAVFCLKKKKQKNDSQYADAIKNNNTAKRIMNKNTLHYQITARDSNAQQ